MKNGSRFYLGSIISIQSPIYSQFKGYTVSHENRDGNFSGIIIMTATLNSISDNGFNSTIKVEMGQNEYSTCIKAQQTFIDWIALA